MIFAWLLYLFSLLWGAVLMFLMVFYIIMYSDLETDYINPIDFSNKMNQFVIPEAAGQGLFPLLFLVTGQWTPLIINIPLLAYNVHRIVGGQPVYDATEIFRTLDKHKKETYIKLGFYLLTFFYYLYRMILALIALDSPS